MDVELVVLEHLAQMPEQAETGDVGAGVNALGVDSICSRRGAGCRPCS